MNQSADAIRRQVFLKQVALRVTHHEEMPDGIGPVSNTRKGEIANSLEQLHVFTGDCLAPFIPLVEFCQLDPQDGCLEFIESRIESFPFIVVLDLRTIVTQHPNPLRQFIIVSYYRAGVAPRSKILSGIEAKGCSISKRADALSPIARAMRLGGIFNHLETVMRSHFINRIHVCRLAIQVNSDYRARVLCDCCFDAAGIDIVSPFIRFDGNWSSARMRDRQPRRYIGVCRHQHLITWSNIQGTHNQVQSIEAITHTNAVFRSAVVGKLRFEVFNLRAEDEPAGLSDL